ncbi:o-succinylbenzoate--CoA ligase [Arenibacter sp. F26102]|uniref:o-succinylbenzoate--CoA ligase n=1 Tax=Arenibacter sp. F26102 TaxID=2926416 RepID=UPI001FF46CD4|nr:o-succinylbenzoate--CoA ligase [Arenibacter sp. F26102]MCK0146676.1 o-succinylbenzoate--CoA ligase [Arenibacter sp. F26102]
MINIFDWFKKWAGYTPNKIAVKDADSGNSLSYNVIHTAGDALANHFIEKHGLTVGDRVAIIAENHLAQVILFAAAQKSGIILVPINFRLAPKEIDALLSDSQCKLAYTDGTIAADNLEYNTKYENLFSVYDFIGKETNEIQPPKLTEDSPIFILYTSGTTGLPKGTVYTHKMLFWNSVNTSQSLLITNNTITLNCMPLFHTGGWNVLLTPVLHRGGTVIMFRKFDPLAVLNCIIEEKLDLFMAVPTMLKMMVELPQFAQADISCLNYIIVGGESMPLTLIETFHHKKVPIRQGYGLTEAGPNLTSLHQNDAQRKQGSIGKPNFYVEIRILNKDNKDVRPNEPGEILIGGPMVMPEYWRNEEATRQAKLDRWLRTGDIGRIDEDGFIYILDRKKNMYISGAENVYPAEVERALLHHPAIKEAVVISAPHPKWGECGIAFLVTEKELTQQELISHCKSHLAKFKIPSQFNFVNEIPKNDTGKIDRKAIRQRFLNQMS